MGQEGSVGLGLGPVYKRLALGGLEYTRIDLRDNVRGLRTLNHMMTVTALANWSSLSKLSTFY